MTISQHLSHILIYFLWIWVSLTHCNTLQHTATHVCHILVYFLWIYGSLTLCNTLQHTPIHLSHIFIFRFEYQFVFTLFFNMILPNRTCISHSTLEHVYPAAQSNMHISRMILKGSTHTIIWTAPSLCITKLPTLAYMVSKESCRPYREVCCSVLQCVDVWQRSFVALTVQVIIRKYMYM